MKWLDRAEAKFGHLAIPGLMRIIVGFNLLVFLLHKVSPPFIDYLQLDPARIRQGEVWRLLTYIFIPSYGGGMFALVGLLFYVLFLLFIGSGLEQALGAFKLNVYYLLGMFGVTVASFFFGPDYAAGLLNITLLFAFARFFPETIIYIAFILPVKVKWLAWFTAAGLILEFATSNPDFRASLLACFVNYIVFFGSEHAREARQRSEIAGRQRKFQADVRQGKSATLHECVVCHRTEEDDRYLDFRIAKDGQEYCLDHLPGTAAEAPPNNPPPTLPVDKAD